ncbi:TRAP transporter small permease subunit [Aestuariibius sp. 2305UL40-4]|uniref:TRAP transporter small permease subunit n=1 Tax=Aestuariibius violaceus TaxID=3234132 RepID=UPI00345E0B50
MKSPASASRSRTAAIATGYVRIVDRMSDYVGYVAMYLIFLMIAVLISDAISDNVFDYPIHWGVELTQFALAAYYFMGGAVTLKNDSHVRMDLIYDRLSETGKAWMDTITIGCLIFYLAVLLFGSVSSLTYAIETGERRFSMWNPSMIPIKVLMVACIVLMLLQSFSQLIKHVATLRGEAIA